MADVRDGTPRCGFVLPQTTLTAPARCVLADGHPNSHMFQVPRLTTNPSRQVCACFGCRFEQPRLQARIAELEAALAVQRVNRDEYRQVWDELLRRAREAADG